MDQPHKEIKSELSFLYKGNPLLTSWRDYFDGMKAPDNFIDLSFLFCIGASLQRRVWIGGTDKKGQPTVRATFPNPYMNFCAPPGVGKGLCTREVKTLFASLSKPLVKGSTPEGLEEVNPAALTPARAKKDKSKKKEEAMQLFPIAPDSVTFEDLVYKNARSIGNVDYTYQNGSVEPKKHKYIHSSMMFVLEELANIVKKNAENTINYLNQAFDCVDYHNSTKGRGEDYIKSPCLSILAGTQPDFMRRAAATALMNEGLLARTILVYADKNRFPKFWMPPTPTTQQKGRDQLRKHIRFLHTLYGNVTIDPEVYDAMEDWAKTEELNRVNHNPKLIHYYVRKPVQIQKLAMCIHFSRIPTGETTEETFKIPIDCFTQAIQILDAIEVHMDRCLRFTETRGPNRFILDVEDWINNNPMCTFKNIFLAFIEKVDSSDDLKVCLNDLRIAGKIGVEDNPESPENEVLYYAKKTT